MSDKPDDPMPAAQSRPYTHAIAGYRDGAYTVLIDQRQLRTPGRNAFALPTKGLAELCAAEWEAQSAAVRPETMPITRLANVAIDQTPRARWRMAESIAGYAQTDLVCHRADGPEGLTRRQKEHWDPLVDWADETLKAPLRVVEGVIATEQPAGARAAFQAAAEAMDDFRLTGLSHAVGMSGSGVLGFAMALGRLDAEAAFQAAMLDDLWQLETWGEDFAARERLNGLQSEFTALGRYFEALLGR